MGSYSQFLDEISGKNINFLIGSGASVGLIPTLWINSLNKSFEELMTSPLYNEQQKKVLYLVWFNSWIRKTSILEEETDDNFKRIHKEYNKFILNLVKILSNEGFDKPKRVNIFTTNYDTLFELSFDKIAAKNRLTFFNDGSRGFLQKNISSENYFINASHSGMSDNFHRSIPTINLLKIHGSVTWSKKEDKISVSLRNEILEEIKNLADLINIDTSSFLHKDNLVEQFLNYRNSPFSERELIDEIDRVLSSESGKINDFYDQYMKLPVVNPTKAKFSETVFEQQYYQMLRLLSYELERKDSVLIVFGFSFADEHILEIVRRSLVNPHLKIYVIGYDNSAKKGIEEKIGGEKNIDFLPSNELNTDGSETNGNFEFLNSLLSGGEEDNDV